MDKRKKKPYSKPSPDEESGLKSYAKFTGLTFEVLALNLIIIGAGYYLNLWVGLKFPWILMMFIFLSVGATIFYLLKRLNN